MKIKCPNCGATTSLDALLSTNAANAAFLAALDVPPALKTELIRYIGLFRSPNRELTFKRAAKLLNELTPAVNAGKLTFNRQTTAAPLVAWQWAIEQVFKSYDAGKLTTPLTNHNYLYTIVQGYDARKHSPEDTPTTAQTGGKTVMLNGVPCAVLAGMSKRETYQYVLNNQSAGETLDETYNRLTGARP